MKKSSRRQFINNCLVGGDYDKLDQYIGLLSRMNNKNKKYGGFLENDLKYLQKQGGFLTGRDNKNDNIHSSNNDPYRKVISKFEPIIVENNQ